MKQVRKEITFIYLDAVQKQVYEMIAEEARKRGYKTTITDDPFAKGEIGWYCEHVNFPKYSKFSVIMLHDINQQYGYWPDLWLREPWNKYDVGFLPSRLWENNWKECSGRYYARTRKGVYLTGWPKADRLAKYRDEQARKAYAEKAGIDPGKPTVLYAPAWEYDGRQDEFVRAMKKLDVNIVIKQPPWAPAYADQIRLIGEMYELHKDDPRVILMDPKENILDVIMISDILVSEESSTMGEAVMMGKPAISVTDWMIPDTDPPRLPDSDPEYTIRTTKAQLTECVKEVLENYEPYRQRAAQYTETHFTNIGKCIPMMMDILDAAVEGRESPWPALAPKEKERVPIRQLGTHWYYMGVRTILYNYCVRNRVIRAVYKAYTRIRYGKDAKEIRRIEG